MCIHEFIFRYLLPWRSVIANSSINTGRKNLSVLLDLLHVRHVSEKWWRRRRGDAKIKVGGWDMWQSRRNRRGDIPLPSDFDRLENPISIRGAYYWCDYTSTSMSALFILVSWSPGSKLSSPYKYWHAYSHNFCIISSIAKTTTPITD